MSFNKILRELQDATTVVLAQSKKKRRISKALHEQLELAIDAIWRWHQRFDRDVWLLEKRGAAKIFTFRLEYEDQGKSMVVERHLAVTDKDDEHVLVARFEERIARFLDELRLDDRAIRRLEAPSAPRPDGGHAVVSVIA